MYRIAMYYEWWIPTYYNFKSKYSILRDKFKDMFYGTLNDALEENAPVKIKDMELEKNWEESLIRYFKEKYNLEITQYEVDGRESCTKKPPEFNWFIVFHYVKYGRIRE